MAAFCPPFLPDSVFDPIKNPSFLDEFVPDFDQFYSSFDHDPLIREHGSCFNTSANESSCLEQQHSISNTTEKQRSESESFTSMTESGEQVSQILIPLDKKRKSVLGSPSNSANSKEVKQMKCRKQKGSKEGMKVMENEEEVENQASEEPPKGYIHVRARRGQATDSHSLAERARREKISQKMKALQALVPGCDKVTGKALMLDEIINYVQSLQNQVEFLSMKLALLDPMVYVFGLMDQDTTTFEIEGMNNGITLPMVSMQSADNSNTSSPTPSLTFTNANAITDSTATATATVFPCPPIDSSTCLFQEEQKPNVHLQDARSSHWGLDDLPQQSIINQFGFGPNNLYNLY